MAAPPVLPPPDPRRRGGGLRREVPVVLPAALLLLVALSAVTLFSYRSGLQLLAEERRDEAGRLAAALAAVAAGGTGGERSLSALRRLAPAARAITLLDTAGRPVAAAGEVPPAPLAPLGGRLPTAPVGRGPDATLPDTVAGFAPLAGGGALRVDLPAAVLAAQLRGLGILLWVVLATDAAILILVVLFLRQVLAPFEALLARARQVGPDGGLTAPAEGDEVEFLLATFERARTALAVRESPESDLAALERTLAASLQSGLLLLDREGGVLALNPVGAELLEVAQPPAGLPIAELLAGQDELAGLLAAALASGDGLQRAECTVRSEAESVPGPRTVGLTVHPLRRGDGAVRGHLVLFADLTTVRREADAARLADSLARLGEMAGGIAHELRNSLATLSGYLTLLERRPDEETVADYLAEIRREADHLQRVLDDFLAFARPGSARPREVALAPLLARAAADPALAEVAVERRGGEGVILTADPQLLERAVRNLLHNAAQAERAAGRAGPVTLRVERQRREGDLEVAVEDRGAGVPAAVRERLFQPFATGRPGGVGLGLSLAYRIAALHGGRIRLDDRPGGGTRAVLVLPGDTIVTFGNEIALSGELETAPGDPE